MNKKKNSATVKLIFITCSIRRGFLRCGFLLRGTARSIREWIFTVTRFLRLKNINMPLTSPWIMSRRKYPVQNRPGWAPSAFFLGKTPRIGSGVNQSFVPGTLRVNHFRCSIYLRRFVCTFANTLARPERAYRVSWKSPCSQQVPLELARYFQIDSPPLLRCRIFSEEWDEIKSTQSEIVLFAELTSDM